MSSRLRTFLLGSFGLVTLLAAVMAAVAAGFEPAAFVVYPVLVALGFFMWGHVYGWAYMAAVALIVILAIVTLLLM